MQKLTLVILFAYSLLLAYGLPSLVATGIGTDVFLDEKITYTASISTASTTLTEVTQYTRTITTVINYPNADFRISIPFTGNQISGRRSRVIVYCDTEAIYDATMYSSGTWDLHPLSIVASKVNLLVGNHVIKILTAVDGGTLYIPHYNPTLIEATISPQMFGRLTYLGFK